MRKIPMAAIALAALPLPAAAFAPGSYYIRNDTPRAVNCVIRRPHSEVTVPVALRAGAEWTDTTSRDDTRTLICYVGALRSTFRVASGQRYALREDNRGALWLRAITAD